MNVFSGDRTLRLVRSGPVRGTDAKSSQLSLGVNFVDGEVDIEME